MADKRQQALERIRKNIEAHGHHVYLISGAEHPKFAYSIGLSPVHGAELLLAGGAYYSAREAGSLLTDIARVAGALRDGAVVSTSFGEFTLRRADATWSDPLMLGALDYYDEEHVPALQIVPPADARTIDVPDCGRPFDPVREPVWQCLTERWPFAISEDSTVVTNFDALRGAPVTDGLRRKEDTWELFAGADPDVPQNDVLVVPLSTLLFFDTSLRPFVDLCVGDGLRREPGGAWRPRKKHRIPRK
jgi:hypothetical protein